MITNDEQLHQAVEQLGRMYRALAGLRAEVQPVNAQQFAVLAEGPLDEIQRLQAEIDAYIGVAAAEKNVAEQAETYIGDLRAIDLDHLSFILRKAGDIQEIRCSFDADLLEAAKEALDRRVQVTGARRVENGRHTYTTLRVTRLEVLNGHDNDAVESRQSA